MQKTAKNYFVCKLLHSYYFISKLRHLSKYYWFMQKGSKHSVCYFIGTSEKLSWSLSLSQNPKKWNSTHLPMFSFCQPQKPNFTSSTKMREIFNVWSNFQTEPFRFIRNAFIQSYIRQIFLYSFQFCILQIVYYFLGLWVWASYLAIYRRKYYN